MNSAPDVAATAGMTAPPPPASANRFRRIALDIRSALFTLNESSVWDE